MAAMAMREITNQEEEDFSTCPGSPQQFMETPTSSDSEDHIIEIPMDVDIHVPNLVHQKEAEQYQPKLTDINEQKGQCRLCHDEDVISHLESPCACKGTLMPYVPNYTVIEPRNAVIGAPALLGGMFVRDMFDPKSASAPSNEEGSDLSPSPSTSPSGVSSVARVGQDGTGRGKEATPCIYNLHCTSLLIFQFFICFKCLSPSASASVSSPAFI
ncbi:Zinc finger, RING/FYVE/PHD-type [Senna tora]|uniref:Zinc finger, RING/FYVE/PHD-type n=1 Tax=Senna tora TaxID=362788 RepID=A0A834WHM4_9FABA|nr:Zinc finger, RING/FYVE/PHD-type [Senna tora]